MILGSYKTLRLYTHTHTYVYIHTEREREREHTIIEMKHEETFFWNYIKIKSRGLDRWLSG